MGNTLKTVINKTSRRLRRRTTHGVGRKSWSDRWPTYRFPCRTTGGGRVVTHGVLQRLFFQHPRTGLTMTCGAAAVVAPQEMPVRWPRRTVFRNTYRREGRTRWPGASWWCRVGVAADGDGHRRCDGDGDDRVSDTWAAAVAGATWPTNRRLCLLCYHPGDNTGQRHRRIRRAAVVLVWNHRHRYPCLP